MKSTITLSGKAYKRIFPESPISDDSTYAVIAAYKDGDGDPSIKHTGTFDECEDYAERNESPDNIERYYVCMAV